MPLTLQQWHSQSSLAFACHHRVLSGFTVGQKVFGQNPTQSLWKTFLLHCICLFFFKVSSLGKHFPRSAPGPGLFLFPLSFYLLASPRHKLQKMIQNTAVQQGAYPSNGLALMCITCHKAVCFSVRLRSGWTKLCRKCGHRHQGETTHRPIAT